jgi:hypothetical protein
VIDCRAAFSDPADPSYLGEREGEVAIPNLKEEYKDVKK